MRLRTQHQPKKFCADSSGLFLQHAAGPGSVRTWKGTSLWGRGSTPEHAVILVFQKKKNSLGIMNAYLKVTHWDTRTHARAHTHRHAENCVAQQMSRCDIWGWREPTWGGKKRKDGIVNIDCACTDTQSEPIHHSTYIQQILCRYEHA